MPEAMLYEHEDGRQAVSFIVPAPFSHGDPKWHRVGPVEVHGADEPACPNCQGSGEIMVMTSHLGPDDYEYPAPCDHCDGKQTLAAAYEGVVKLLEKERAEALKLSGKLYGLKHFHDARDAFLLEVGEDLARWKDPIGYWKDKAASAAARFDAAGFRAWVLKNLPDDTVIGSSAWWADHLSEWASRFVKTAPVSHVPVHSTGGQS